MISAAGDATTTGGVVAVAAAALADVAPRGWLNSMKSLVLGREKVKEVDY